MPQPATTGVTRSRELTKRADRDDPERIHADSASGGGIRRFHQRTYSISANCSLSHRQGGVERLCDPPDIPAQECGIALGVEGLDSLPMIQADESQLFNAFYNLVNNALAEVPPDGSITISGSRRSQDGRNIMVSVSDTGRGMPREVRESLFTYHAISRKGRRDRTRNEDCEGCHRRASRGDYRGERTGRWNLVPYHVTGGRISVKQARRCGRLRETDRRGGGDPGSTG